MPLSLFFLLRAAARKTKNDLVFLTAAPAAVSVVVASPAMGIGARVFLGHHMSRIVSGS